MIAPLGLVHPGAIFSVLVFGLLIGWIFWRWSRESEDQPQVLAVKIIVSLALIAGAFWCMGRFPLILGGFAGAFIGVLLGTACALVLGIIWGKNIGAGVGRMITSFYDDGAKLEPTPFYAIAEAHRKQARHALAITEIEEQLRRFPGDVRGLLLLAEIKGRHLGDWSGAEQAIEEIVEQSQLPVATRAKALQALADWHLDLANDGVSAQRILQRISDLFPDTPEAIEAAQRLAHIGDGTWRDARHAPPTLRIVPGDDRLGLRLEPSERPPERDPEAEADALRRHLITHPQDHEARERLALIYADDLGHRRWAVSEIETLLAQPHAPPKSVARWLHLLADVHIRNAGDEDGARAALARIIQSFPGTALAANAQSRLDHLKLELRARSTASRLGLQPRQDPGEP